MRRRNIPVFRRAFKYDRDIEAERAASACLGRRASRYRRAVESGRADGRCDADIEAQVRRYYQSQQYQYRRDRQTKEVLARFGVPGCLVLSYLNFGRSMDRVGRRFQGGTRDRAAELLIDQALALGLNRTVCDAIRESCFEPGQSGRHRNTGA